LTAAGLSHVTIRLTAIALAAVICLSCAREPAEIRYRFTAMGTLVEVTIYDFPTAAAEEAARDVETLFLELQDAWDPWGNGELAELNSALAAGDEPHPDEDLADLLSRASRISAATGGAFDPAVGQLVKLWGFHDAEALPDAPPSATRIQQVLDTVKPLPQIWDGERGILAGATGTAIDLGAFAKGEAVDRAIMLLRSAGVRDAIVNAGGDLRAIGRRGARPWKIGIREPRKTGILASIEVSGDESVFTSGDYERYFEHKGTRYHHILDPRTGYPTRELVSVTILGPSAAESDAACTALMVAGLGHWPAVARALGIREVMVVDQNGVIQMSPQMRDRVTILREEAPPVEIRDIS
jgi:thiamine biosynthesis lipoprotein